MKIYEEKIKNQRKSQDIKVDEAKYLDDYKIRVVFNDGKKNIINFKRFLTKSKNPQISQYLKKNQFKKFKVSYGNLNWNDYDMIFPVEELYKNKI